MKTRWLVVLLAVSLALNAGAVGALLLHGFRRWSGERRFYRELKVDCRERVSVVLEGTRQEMDSLRSEHFRTRRALALLGDSEQPDPAEVDSLLDRLAAQHREMNRLAFAAGRELFQLFPEQHRGRMRERWRKMHHRPGPRGEHPRRFRERRGPDRGSRSKRTPRYSMPEGRTRDSEDDQ